jgi:hypothetical protein
VEQKALGLFQKSLFVMALLTKGDIQPESRTYLFQ